MPSLCHSESNLYVTKALTRHTLSKKTECQLFSKSSLIFHVNYEEKLLFIPVSLKLADIVFPRTAYLNQLYSISLVKLL